MTTERFSRYDTADYLKTDEDIAAYLEAVMEDGDPALIAAALGDVARAQHDSLGSGSGHEPCWPQQGSFRSRQPHALDDHESVKGPRSEGVYSYSNTGSMAGDDGPTILNACCAFDGDKADDEPIHRDITAQNEDRDCAEFCA